MPGLRLYGIAGERRFEWRVPTFSFTVKGWTPRQIAEHLAGQRINVWNGNFYALAVTQRLGLESSGGLVRVGATHYNTVEEVQKFGEVLRSL